jgi:hypothetical protein
MKDEILPKLSNLQSSPKETIREVFGQPRVCYTIISSNTHTHRERERESFKTKYGDTENIKQNLLTCTQLSTNRVLKKQLKDQLHHITILRIMEKELKIRPQHKHKFLQYSVGVVQLE